MLTHPTEHRLIGLGLTGMADAFVELQAQDNAADLAHAEWLALLLDREAATRNTKRFQSRLRSAKLRHGQASIEDVDYRTPRRLDKALFARLAAGDWIDRHQNLIVIGPTGVGKSWIACALAHTACRNDRSVLYHRLPRLFDALALARGDGRHARLLKSLARVDLLILDDVDGLSLTAS
jgi:DNA replication protein DnaC